jgi:hypothetical protein
MLKRGCTFTAIPAQTAVHRQVSRDRTKRWMYSLTCFEVFHQPVDTSGNAMVSLAGQSSLDSKEDWPTPLRCWFDLNYADKGGQGIGALVVSVTSVAAEATTYSPSSKPTSSSPVSTTAAAPSATGSQATVANAQPTATSTNTANNPPASSAPAAASDTTSLSGGAIAGIAIGALAGVGAITAIAFLLYRRSRKQNNYGSHPDQNYGNEVVKYGHEGKPYGVAVGHVQQHHEPAPGYEAPTYEMQGTDVQELSALQSAKGSLRERRH